MLCDGQGGLNCATFKTAMNALLFEYSQRLLAEKMDKLIASESELAPLVFAMKMMMEMQAQVMATRELRDVWLLWLGKDLHIYTHTHTHTHTHMRAHVQAQSIDTALHDGCMHSHPGWSCKEEKDGEEERRRSASERPQLGLEESLESLRDLVDGLRELRQEMEEERLLARRVTGWGQGVWDWWFGIGVYSP